MKIISAERKILVIHGPNMNLLGFRKRGEKKKITLDKLNCHLREMAKEKKLSLIILQTNDEIKAVNQLQKRRKKIKGILLFPGPWQKSGYVIKDTLDILSIPYTTVSLGEKAEVLKGEINIKKKDIFESTETALTALTEHIQFKDK